MNADLKARAISLRKAGKTYSEIRATVGRDIPKSTLSYWCRHIVLPAHKLNRIEQKIAAGGSKGLAVAHAHRRLERVSYLRSLYEGNLNLQALLNKDIRYAKAVLATLYLAEGGKRRRGAVMFGNSNPQIVVLFLRLMRRVYAIDDSKFRCTLLCRADQDIKKLQSFWALATGVPKEQFYTSRIDARTIGKKSRNPKYKGVCRIDYFSAEVYNDLIAAGDALVGVE